MQAKKNGAILFGKTRLWNNCECHLRVNNRSAAHTTFVSLGRLSHDSARHLLRVPHQWIFDAARLTFTPRTHVPPRSYYIIVNLLTWNNYYHYSIALHTAQLRRGRSLTPWREREKCWNNYLLSWMKICRWLHSAPRYTLLYSSQRHCYANESALVMNWVSF